MKSNPAKYQAKLKEIAARTGIDFVKYRDPLLVEKLGNMLTIQLYAFKAIAIPTAVLMLLFAGIAGYACISSKIAAGIVIGLIGIIPSIGLGILIGMVVLMSTIKNDVQSILALSIDTVSVILNDTNSSFQNRISNVSGAATSLPKVSDLLQGVLFGIILPSLQQVIVSKFKLLRVPLEYLFVTTIQTAVSSALALLDDKASKMLNKHADKIATVMEKANSVSVETAEVLDARLSAAIKRLDDVKEIINTKIESAGTKIIAPLKLLMVMAAMVTIILVAAYIKLFI